MSDYYSIGFTRDDGDFEVFCGLNNSNQLLSEVDFLNLSNIIQDYLNEKADIMELNVEKLELESTWDILVLNKDLDEDEIDNNNSSYDDLVDNVLEMYYNETQDFSVIADRCACTVSAVALIVLRENE